MIEIKGLTKVYKNLTAVNDLNLTINEGDIFGFIGPNGAGKTTTIKMLSTLIKPTAGSATVAGFSILTQPLEVKQAIGYMPDTFGLYDDMKVWEYLDYFAAAYKIAASRRPKLIDDVLNLTDLIVKKDDYIEALSRGMKQRLALAKTLIHDPKVLLLDEPASGLDPRARIELRELLKELRKMGKTILISSHILTELADFCNTIGIIEQGRLLAAGDVKEIMREMAAGSHVVEVKVRGEADRAADLLRARPEVQKVDVEADVLEVYLKPEMGEESSFILETLVANGIKVASVKDREVDLEDIFMRITKGAVQ